MLASNSKTRKMSETPSMIQPLLNDGLPSLTVLYTLLNIMTSWHHGIMASWHHGIMASWHHGFSGSLLDIKGHSYHEHLNCPFSFGA